MNICKGYSKLWFLALLLVTFVAGCGSNEQEVPNVVDTTLPMASSTFPSNAATGVPIGNKLTVTFNQAMNPATINTTTFTVKQGATPVLGTVTYSGVTAVFTPASNLAINTVYTATITTGAKSLGGKALASDLVWNFTTGTTADTTKPAVSSTLPVNGATAVPIVNKLSATFSETMDPTTITTTTFTVKQGTTPVSGTVAYSGVTAVFTPASNLAVNTVYTATITTGVKDLGGNTLAVNNVWTFTTGVAADITPPTAISTVPANAATGVALNSTVSATFSEAMAPATITATTFTVKQGATPVSGTVAYSGVTAVFTPASNLAVSTVYTATITTGAKDLAGNTLAANKVWSFTTAATAPVIVGTVPLGTAVNYAILAKTGVSTVPSSVVTGNIGLSPAARGGLTGWSFITEATDTFFTSAQVVAPGKLFAADNVGGTTSVDLTTAVADMGTAYTNAAGRTATSAATTNVGAGTLTSLTLTPGVYEWGTSVNIPTDLTLNGSATDVWIFKVAGTLNMAAVKNVILTGGALPKNIFWQVSGAVTIGAGTHFEGIILGQTAITLGNLASINGRLLAQTAVILDASTVTAPAP